MITRVCVRAFLVEVLCRTQPFYEISTFVVVVSDSGNGLRVSLSVHAYRTRIVRVHIVLCVHVFMRVRIICCAVNCIMRLNCRNKFARRIEDGTARLGSNSAERAVFTRQSPAEAIVCCAGGLWLLVFLSDTTICADVAMCNIYRTCKSSSLSANRAFVYNIIYYIMRTLAILARQKGITRRSARKMCVFL